MSYFPTDASEAVSVELRDGVVVVTLSSNSTAERRQSLMHGLTEHFTRTGFQIQPVEGKASQHIVVVVPAGLDIDAVLHFVRHYYGLV